LGTLQIHGYSSEQSLYENRPAAIHLSGNVRDLLQFNVLYDRFLPKYASIYIYHEFSPLTDRYLEGIQIKPRQKNTAVISYADDVTILPTTNM